MLKVVSLVLLLSATEVSADPVRFQTDTECQSCTARHKSLQRLQDARTAPAQAEEGASPPATDRDAQGGPARDRRPQADASSRPSGR